MFFCIILAYFATIILQGENLEYEEVKLCWVKIPKWEETPEAVKQERQIMLKLQMKQKGVLQRLAQVQRQA